MLSWNLNGLALWDHLDADAADLVLLQEAPIPPAHWRGSSIPDPEEGWSTQGWKPGTWSRRTAIVSMSDRVTVEARSLTTVADLDSQAIPVSRPGTLTVADVHVGDETITVASMYGGWERSADPRRLIYADAAAHRLLSDLASLITSERRHRLLVAGDLNILYGYGEAGSSYWAGRYASVFDRAESMGLRFVGPQSPHGRQADPWPPELPADSRNVPTYHTRAQGPSGATRQLDFVFASTSIAERVTTHAHNPPDDWGPSDHCRISIDVHSAPVSDR